MSVRSIVSILFCDVLIFCIEPYNHVSSYRIVMMSHTHKQKSLNINRLQSLMVGRKKDNDGRIGLSDSSDSSNLSDLLIFGLTNWVNQEVNLFRFVIC